MPYIFYSLKYCAVLTASCAEPFWGLFTPKQWLDVGVMTALRQVCESRDCNSCLALYRETRYFGR